MPHNHGGDGKKVKFDKGVSKAVSILSYLERRLNDRILGLEGKMDHEWNEKITAELLPWSLWFLLNTTIGQAILSTLICWQIYVLTSGAINLILRLFGLLRRKPRSSLTCIGCLSQICYESDLALNPLSVVRENNVQTANFCYHIHQRTTGQIGHLKQELDKLTQILIRQETRYLTRNKYSQLDVITESPEPCVATGMTVEGEKSHLLQ